MASDALCKRLVDDCAILMLPGTMFQPEGSAAGKRQIRIAFANIDADGHRRDVRAVWRPFAPDRAAWRRHAPACPCPPSLYSGGQRSFHQRSDPCPRARKSRMTTKSADRAKSGHQGGRLDPDRPSGARPWRLWRHQFRRHGHRPSARSAIPTITTQDYARACSRKCAALAAAAGRQRRHARGAGGRAERHARCRPSSPVPRWTTKPRASACRSAMNGSPQK